LFSLMDAVAMDSARSAFPALPRGPGNAPRCVAHLAFAEILVIWALRRYNACQLSREGRTAAIAPEFSRALGLARLEETLTAFAGLADSLAAAARLPQAQSQIEDDRINPTEEAVLSALAALQHGAERQAAALCEWCLLPAGRKGFLAGARCLARSLREAGHTIPYQAPKRRSFALDTAAEEARPLPTAQAMSDLKPAEHELVTALRLWVAAFTRQEDPLHAARRHFERQFNGDAGGEPTPGGRIWGDPRPGGDAGLSLHAVLRNTTLAATRSVDVRCPTCPGFSPDEARLLCAVAWLQRDVDGPAECALGDWLAPAALRLSMHPARGLAQSLLVMERLLPLRDWDFTALEAAAAPPPRDGKAPDDERGETEWQVAERSGAPTLH
jgi:hypothetical protein